MINRPVVMIVVTLGPLTLLAVGTGAVRTAPVALASGGSSTSVSFSPAGGTAGTFVTATLSLQPPPATPATYTLAVSDAPDYAHGCAHARPIANVTPVRLVADNPQDAWGRVSFRWPAVTGPGLFWLCALPAGGDIPVLSSAVPFVAGGGSAASVRPLPTQPRAGASLTVVVAGWHTSNDADPALYLTPVGSSSAAPLPMAGWGFSAAVGTDRTTYAYGFTLPATLARGAYVIVAIGDCGDTACVTRVTSPTFTLLSNVAPMPASGPTATPLPAPAVRPAASGPTSSAAPLLISAPAALAVFASLLLLACGVFLAWRRVWPHGTRPS